MAIYQPYLALLSSIDIHPKGQCLLNDGMVGIPGSFDLDNKIWQTQGTKCDAVPFLLHTPVRIAHEVSHHI